MSAGTAVKTAAGAAMLLLLIAACSSLYAVDEKEYALALRFGEVNAVRMEPGLYLKAPMVDSIQRIDRRTLRADIPPREVPDKDKERLIIDVVIRYEITAPVQFRKTLRNEDTALERLKTITYSALRDTIGQHDRTEVIGARLILDEAGQMTFDREGLPRYESLEESRREISDSIHSRIAQAARDQKYGLEIISANIKRADFPGTVESAIIDRLAEERKRVAADHRARGEEEYRSRTAPVDRAAAVLIAEAEKDARTIRGEGEAEVIRLVRDALLQDEDFYRFQRTLESYLAALKPGTVVVAEAKAGEFLEYLLRPPRPPPEAGKFPGRETAAKSAEQWSRTAAYRQGSYRTTTPGSRRPTEIPERPRCINGTTRPGPAVPGGTKGSPAPGGRWCCSPTGATPCWFGGFSEARTGNGEYHAPSSGTKGKRFHRC